MSFNVEIMEHKECEIKKGPQKGQKMGIITVKDNSDQMSCMIFGECYEIHKSLLYPGSTIHLVGYKSKKDSLVMEIIRQL